MAGEISEDRSEDWDDGRSWTFHLFPARKADYYCNLSQTTDDENAVDISFERSARRRIFSSFCAHVKETDGAPALIVQTSCGVRTHLS